MRLTGQDHLYCCWSDCDEERAPGFFYCAPHISLATYRMKPHARLATQPEPAAFCYDDGEALTA